jgi:hypothetical protein
VQRDHGDVVRRPQPGRGDRAERADRGQRLAAKIAVGRERTASNAAVAAAPAAAS